MTHDFSRRALLQGASALTAGAFLANLASIGQASAATSGDYRALVCVFLYGGNDYGNTLVPYDDESRADYLAQRPTIGFRKPDDPLLQANSQINQVPITSATLLKPLDGKVLSNSKYSSIQYALEPNLQNLAQLFNQGSMAVVLNLGTLTRPTTMSAYQSKSSILPPNLMSHIDQQTYWQTSGASTGWGGGAGDQIAHLNYPSNALTCINLSPNAIFLTGQSVFQYSVSTSGPIPLMARGSLFGSTQAANCLTSIMQTAPSDDPFQNAITAVASQSLGLHDQINNALARATNSSVTYPSDNSLADQLKEVAKLISVNGNFSVRRQVFFVSLGGFDTHDGLVSTHPKLMAQLDGALSAFYEDLNHRGLGSNVTTFTASDFGRALTTNKDGSDHGWGSHHFVLGGAVKGGRFYGIPPVLGNNGPDDVGQGRLLPTTSVDQYAATLASWFGVPDSAMATVLPNIRNYSTQNLGFI